MGVIMPVVDIDNRYLRPAKHEDLITVKTAIKKLPAGHKIIFHAEIYNQHGEPLNNGAFTLYFMLTEGMKRRDMPGLLRDMVIKYFEGRVPDLFFLVKSSCPVTGITIQPTQS